MHHTNDEQEDFLNTRASSAESGQLWLWEHVVTLSVSEETEPNCEQSRTDARRLLRL